MLRRFFAAKVLLLAVVVGLCPLAEAQATLDFTVDPPNPSVNEDVCFTAVVVTGDPSWFVLYEWDYNQDGAYDAAGPNVCHPFTTAGVYPVTLRATDDRGGFHFVQKNVVVTNEAPTAAFTYTPLFPSAGQLVSFDGTGSFDPDGVIVTYEWDCNNDGVFEKTGQIVRHTFLTSGQHPVTLKVTDDGGVWDAELKVISVQPIPPVACFTYAPLSPSVYDDIAFSAICSMDPDGGPIVQYGWAFGDGEIGTGATPTHSYANGGVYEVFLTVTDDDQQTDTFSDILVVGGPSAAFSYAPLAPTTQDPVQFFDQSSDTTPDDIASWSWDFADGGFSNEQNPLHTFPTSGTYPVQLTVTSEGGATSSVTRTINVRNAPPHAAFTFAPATPKVDQMVTFSAGGSSDPDGTVVMYEWDFDNNGLTDATGATVTHAFSVVGARPVRLTVTDNEGASAAVTKVVPVQGAPPVACFVFTPAEPYTGQAVPFDGSCSTDPDGNIILYEWDFDDDGTTDATGMSVTHSFPAAGVYPVTLTVTDNDQHVDAQTQGVPVEVGGTSGDNQPPDADFTIEFAEGEEANLNEVITFKADGSSDPDGTIIAYEWDFDDDGAYDATGTTASHVYHTGGAKIVTLRVTDDDGAFGYKTKVVSVEFVRPTAEFTFSPTQPKVGEVVAFDAGDSSDRDGTVEFYEWDFDDDGRTDATGQSVNYVFDDGGSQPVTLVVTDNDGVTDALTKPVQVAVNSPPIADFTYSPADPTTATMITFSDGSLDSDGHIVSRLWDFGDGTGSSQQTPSHRYETADVYEVTLTVTDNEGAADDVVKNVTVTPIQITLVADFGYAPLAGVQHGIQFTDQSADLSSTITEWNWDFGDGDGSTDQNPTHTYASADQYTVTLTVINAAGHSDEETKTVLVNGAGNLYMYPNPAGRSVRVVVTLPDGAEDPVLRVYDVTGKLVYEGALSETGETQWNLRMNAGEEIPNGLYFCFVIATADGRTVRTEVFKLLVVR